MRCPKCDRSDFKTAEPCSKCQFSGDSVLIAELAHIGWLLNEIDTWGIFGFRDTLKGRIQKKYILRKKELEIELGLRLPVFSENEARQAWPELYKLEALRRKLDEWLDAGYLKLSVMHSLPGQYRNRLDELINGYKVSTGPSIPGTMQTVWK